MWEPKKAWQIQRRRESTRQHEIRALLFQTVVWRDWSLCQQMFENLWNDVFVNVNVKVHNGTNKRDFWFSNFFLTTYEHMMSGEKALYWSQELSGTKDLLLPAQSYIMHSILKQWIATK